MRALPNGTQFGYQEGVSPGVVDLHRLISEDWETRRRARLRLGDQDRERIRLRLAQRCLCGIVEDLVVWIRRGGDAGANADRIPLSADERGRWRRLLEELEAVDPRGSRPNAGCVAACARGWLRYGLLVDAPFPERPHGLTAEQAELVGARASETAEQLAEAAGGLLWFRRER